MAAIVSGGALGLLDSSLFRLGAAGQAGTAAQGRAGERFYVNAATGDLYIQGQDEVLVGRGPDAALLRTYNSQGLLNDDNGDNWRLGLYRKVYGLTGTVNTAGSTVQRVDADGSVASYTYDTTRGKYVSTAGSGGYDTLSYNAGTQAWTWDDGESTVTETYDGANGGRLTAVTDASGNAMTLVYGAGGLLSEVHTAGGEVTYLDYSGTNLTQLRTVKSGGAALIRTRYTYDASNRLTQVITDLSPDDAAVADGRTYATSYTYDGTSRRVATMTQSDGTSLTFAYVLVGADYRVSSITDALGRATSFAYDTTNRVTTVTDPLNLVTRFTYDAAGQLTRQQNVATGQQVDYAYDASGNLTQVTDARGNAVAYGYDANGNRTSERDALGNTVTRVYNANNLLLAETAYKVPDPDGAGAAQPSGALTTRSVYDSAGRVRFTVGAEGRVAEYRYDGSGQLAGAIQYTGNTYSVAALNPGDTLTEAQLTTWLGTADKSKSIRVDTAYDFRGQAASATTYAKVDSAGNGVADGSQAVTTFVYDQAGNLLKTVDARGTATSDPNDYTTSLVYDGMGRVLSTTDGLGRVTLTQYDDVNRKTVLTLANGLVRTSTYDAAGEIVSVVESSGAQSLGETKYFYDADGRLRRAEDPTGVKTHVLYDEAGRKIAQIDGTGSLTEYRYDANNNVTRTISYATAVSASALASLTNAQGVPQNVALASIRPATNAADRSTWAVYDAANRQVAVVDGAGDVTQSFYDGAGRVTDAVRFATPIATGALGDAPALAAVLPASTGSDRLTRGFYDAQGKALGTLDAEGYLVEYKYDSAGQLVETVGYATATSAALRSSGTLDQLRPASSAGDIHGYTLYNARGQVAGTVDGEGYLTETVYDAAGNKTQVVRYATRVTYTAGATLASLRPAANAQDQADAYAYDAANQLASHTKPDGTLCAYAYDNVGNLLRKTEAAGTADVRTVNARYDRQGRLTGELSGIGSALLTGGQTQAQIDQIWATYGVTHTYDAAGRRTSTTDALGNKTLFYYDADGHLAYTVNALGEVKGQAYNALGQVVQTIQYGKRLSGATLATLAGGLADATLQAALTALADPLRDAQVTYTYTASGDLQVSVDALGFQTTLTYDAFGEVISRSQQIGGGQSLTQTAAYDRRGLSTQTALDQSGVNAVSVTAYDAFGRATATTDAKGNVRSASYDRLGHVVATVDPTNAQRSTTYDAFGRTLTQTDALGKTTSYSYNTANRSITVTTPEGVVLTTLANRLGQKISVTDGRGYATTWQYDADGNLVGVTTPAGSAASAYDRAGRLVDSVDARGTHTSYAYDAAGRVLSRVVDPGGLALTTTYAYDALGEAISVIDANGVETRTSYDRKGQVVSVVVDPNGLRLESAFTYDGRGKKLTVTEAANTPQARVTQYTYDKLGRLLSQQLDPSGLNLTTSYAYDKNNNVVAQTNAGGYVTRYVYDGADRPIYAVDALGGVTRTEYDAEGRVTRVTSFANAINVAALPAAPAASDIVVTADATRDRVVTSVYDADGRERFSIDSLGGVTEKVYDANGNVVRKVAYANRLPAGTQLTAAAVAAAMAGAASANDEATRLFYDEANRLIFTIDPTGAVVHSYYDANGNVVRVHAYGTPVGSAPLTVAQLQALAVASADRETRYVYDAAGRQVYAIDAENYVKEAHYDNLGRITETIGRPYRVRLGPTPTLAEVAAALSPTVATGVSNVTVTQYTTPVQSYAYSTTANNDTTSAATQTVAVTAQSSTASRPLVQPYALVAAAKLDGTAAATQSVTLSVQNTSITQSGNVANNAWYRSGTTLVQGAGQSIVAGYVSYADNTPTNVRATLYRNGVNLGQISTDVGYATTDAWSVANAWDEYGNPVSYRTAYGTRWNNVSGWTGQVNISTGTLAAGTYSVVLEAWDSAQAGMAENAFYDLADGTWSYSNTITVNVGLQVQPTYVRWATSTQPAGTSSVTFKYRTAGSSGGYTNAAVGVNGANHEVNLGAIGAGNYEYVVEYRDTYGRLLKSASGTLTTSDGQSTTAAATFNYTAYSSSAAAGTSLRFFTQASQWAPVDHIAASVTDSAGNVVCTATTYPEAEASYNGEVNLKVGAALADGRYTVALTLYNKNGTTTAVTPFVYETGSNGLPPLQTYAFEASARADSAAASSVTVNVSNATEFQSASLQNYSYTRSGSTLVQGAGLSVKPGNVSYGDATPTTVRATVYQGTTQVAQITTDTGYANTEAWSVADGWDEYGNPISYRTAYGTNWNNVGNWAGQVNLPTNLAPGHYKVVLETRDDAQAGQAENAFYDRTDGTWAYSATLNDVVIGTIVQPTVLSWAAATQPAGTAAVTFGYRAAGSTGAYSSVAVTTAGANQQASIAALGNGNYEFRIEYRDANGLLLKYSKGNFTSTQGAGSAVSASFSALASAASAGSSIRYFGDASQWASIDHVTATVKDQFGNVVNTATTYPDAEANYYGEVNLKAGAALADGHYRIELALYDKNGGVTNATPFDYDVGVQSRLQETISWAASTQPAGTTATFRYRLQGSSGSWASASVATAGGNQQVALDWMPAGTYEYQVEYRDSYNRLLKNAAGAFTVAASGSTTTNVGFSYTAYGCASGTGSSISGYIPLAQVPTIASVQAVVKNFVTGATVSSAITYPEFEPNYAGNVNLSVGSVLADGRYNLVITRNFKDGTSSSATVYYEVGPQPYAHRTTTLSWNAANQPTGTTAEFCYAPAGQTNCITVPVQLVGDTFQVTLTQDNDDGVITGLAEGTYDYYVRYKIGGSVVKEARGQFTPQASGSSSATLDFAPGTTTASYTNSAAASGQMTQQLAQPYTYVAAAKADTASGASQAVAISVSNATEFQSASLQNYSYTRSGSTLVQGAGLSVKPGNVSYGDATPTLVRATVYQGTTQVAQITTDTGYANTEAWSVADGWDEYGNPISYRTAYGTNWNNVGNWAGQANLPTNLAPGHYRVVLETRDDAQAGQAENAFYDRTDGTWAYSATLNDVVVGTIAQPTVLSWAASTQPALTSNVTFEYRAAGSTGAYSSATITAAGTNQQVSIGGLANGSYEYRIQYKDSYGRILKSSTGTFASTQGGSSSVNASFSYTQVACSAGTGSSIRYYTQAAQWAPVDHIAATVRDGLGNVVSTALTYWEAEPGYNGEVNLKAGAALADGRYTVELTVYNKDGTTATVAPFLYEIGSTAGVTRTTSVSWSASTKPAAATTVELAYTRAGQSGETVVTPTLVNGSYQVLFLRADGSQAGLADGIYDYTVRYKQGSTVLASAHAQFAVGAGESGSQTLQFATATGVMGDRVNTFAYDHAGRLIQSTDALGAAESYSYDALGNKLSYTNKKGAVWSYAYDKAGRMLDEFSPGVAVTSTSGSVENGVALRTHVEYDALGNVTARTEAYGRPEARTTSYQYDASGRQVRTNFPRVNIYNAAADDLGANSGAAINRTEVAADLYSQVFYDTLGRAVVSRAANGTYSYKVYDAGGNLRYDIDAEHYVVEYRYDAFGNRTSTTRYAQRLSFAGHADGAAWTLAQVASGLTTSGTDRRIDQVYDRNNRVVEVDSPQSYVYDSVNNVGATAGGRTLSEYNAFGQVVRQRALASVDALGNPASWADTYFYYDDRGAKAAQIDVEGYVTEWRYDAAGNTIRQTEYARRAVGGYTSTSDYRGYLPSAGDADSGYDRVTAYGYDLADRKVSQTLVGAHFAQLSGTTSVVDASGDVTTTYGYDAVGNLISTTLASGATTYTYYDALGRTYAYASPARQTTDASRGGATITPLTTFGLDSFGKTVRQSVLANGAATANAAGFTAGAASGADQIGTFVYDAHGNLLQSTDAEGAAKYYSYDAASHVAKSWQPSTERNLAGAVVATQNLVQTFQYDADGNQVATIDSSTRRDYVDPVYQGASNLPMTLSGGVALSASFNPQYDEYGNVIGGWQPSNSVNVGWGLNLAGLGGGDVLVVLNYNRVAGGANSLSFTFGGGTTTGATLNWDDGSWGAYGISAITGLSLYKKDTGGNWILLQSGANGSSGTLVGWQLPSSGAVSLSYRASAAASWTTAPVVSFGLMNVADLRAAGSVQFQMVQTTSDGAYAYQAGSVAGGGISASAILNEQRATYNAFGEVAAKSVDGRPTEYFDYDNAGHLWRTNQQDGVDKVYLYDLQGKATAQIRSLTADLKNGYASAAAVDAATRAPGSAIRTETQYDKLERAVRTELPAYGAIDPTVVHAPAALATNATGGLSYGQEPITDEYGRTVGYYNTGWVYDEYGNTLGWHGIAYVNASWTALPGWGGGDYQVQADVVTTRHGSTTLTTTVAATATGATMSLNDEVASISRVRVYKRDAAGAYQLVEDSATPGTRRLSFPTPSAQPGDVAEFLYRPTGTSTWTTLTPKNFGAMSMVDLNSLANGAYDYQVRYKHSDGTVYATGSGVLTLAAGSASLTGSSGAQAITPVIDQTLDRWSNTLSAVDPRFGTDAAATTAKWEKRYRYDEQNHLLSETSPEILVQDANGGIRTVRAVTRNFYDNLGNTIATQDANAVDADTNNNGVYEYANTARYNAGGQVTRQVNAGGGVVDYQYDVFGGQVGTWDARNYYTAQAFDRNDRLVQVTRPDGTVEQYRYDEMGNRVWDKDGRGYWTGYSYDAGGRVFRATQPGGQTVSTYYDQLGRKTREVNANGEAQTWQYDKFGHAVSYTDLAGLVTTSTFNRLGQTATASNSRSSTTYTYDINGALKRMDNSALSPDNSAWWAQSTAYQYDAAGNRTRETYTKWGTVYADTVMGYDALNRVYDVNDLRYHLGYTYDANGNRRHTTASYYNNAGVYVNPPKEYWYTYDRMNRITLAQGVMSGGIVIGSQGTAISYDAAGNRVAANGATTGNVNETYQYDANGRLYQTNRNGVISSYRYYDASNNVVQQNTYDGGGALTSYSVSSYDGNGWLSQQNNYKRFNYTDGGGNFYAMDALSTQLNYTGRTGTGQVASYNMVVYNPSVVDQGYGDEYGWHPSVWINNPYQYTNYYSYSYAKVGGSYKENVVYGSSSYFQPGSTTTRYDGNGNIYDVSDQFQGSNYRSFLTDQSGRILQKSQNGSTEYYFYAGDKPLGATGASTADFDYNYTPVSNDFPARSPSSVVVAAGDTLRSIAQSAYGDAGLWYLIADANGISSDSQLRVGMDLKIPNKITNLHNTYQTFKPYEPGKIIGDTTPTLPNPPPPPPPPSKGKKCGGFLTIVMIVVAVVAACFIGPAALLLMQGVMGVGLAATIAAGAITGAAVSMVTQAVGIATGMQHGFSWSAVAAGAITGALTAGITGAIPGVQGAAPGAIAPSLGTVGNAVVSNVIGQGVNIMLGQQSSFSWTSVAASAVGSAVSSQVSSALAPSNSTLPGTGFQQFAADFAGSAAGSVARAVVSGGKIDIRNIAADAFGNALGNAISSSFKTDAQRTIEYQNNADNEDAENGAAMRANAAAAQQAASAANGATAAPAQPADSAGGGGGDDLPNLPSSASIAPTRGLKLITGDGIEFDPASPADEFAAKAGIDLDGNVRKLSYVSDPGATEDGIVLTGGPRPYGGTRTMSDESIDKLVAGFEQVADPVKLDAARRLIEADQIPDPQARQEALEALRDEFGKEASDLRRLSRATRNRDELPDIQRDISSYTQLQGLAHDALKGPLWDYQVVGAYVAAVDPQRYGEIVGTLALDINGPEARVLGMALRGQLGRALGGSQAARLGAAAGEEGAELQLRYKPGWTEAQRAEADAKVKYLNEQELVVTPSDRSGTRSQMDRYRTDQNLGPNRDVDHKQDLQLGGGKGQDNLWDLDSSVNRSLGKQIDLQIRKQGLTSGTKVNKITIK